VDPDAAEIRVLGCLLEKQRTTPDAYPLTLNALRSACNQSTNREPVVDFDEQTIRDAAHRLWRRGWARLASGAGSRAAKYRHLLDEALGLDREQLAMLCVLMLRGPQTPGELKGRTERLHPLGGLEDVERVLDALIGRELVRRLDRRPGQKEVRYEQLLGGDAAGEPAGVVPPAATAPPGAPPSPADRASSGEGALADRVERLESELAALRDRLDEVLG